MAALSVSALLLSGGEGGGISVSWLPPAGTFCICLQHSSIALAATAAAVAAALVVAVVASCPRGGARLAPTVLIFIHSVNMQIARPEPGLAWPAVVVTRRATSPQAPIVLAEFSQQRLAASKPFWPNVFFSPVFWSIKHAAAPHSPSTDDTIFGMRPGAVPDTDTGIMCWPR